MATTYEYIKEYRKRNPGCRTEEARRYRAKHPEKLAANSKAYRERHLEKVRERDRLAQAASRKNNPEAQRLRNERYRERQRQKQIAIAGRAKPDVCEICKECNRYIVFDHCHTSNLFRGWLCDRCNKVLGILKDNPILIRKLADYVENFNEQIDIKRT